MLHESRALRRASTMATARDAARRPMLILGTITATILGVTLSAGIASAPASGAANPVAAVVSPSATGTDALGRIADQAALPVAEAESAVAEAEAVTEQVAASGLEVSGAPVVDASALEDSVDSLEKRDTMPSLVVTVLSGTVETQTETVVAETAALQDALSAAKEKKAADDAAAAAAEKAAAEAAALASANTADGAKARARDLMSSRYGWGADQFSCLDSLWTKESGWNYRAYNASSGATGIPQALPGSKMASAGGDWQSNAATQVAWGLGYIAAAYGTPCSAWSHSQATDWY